MTRDALWYWGLGLTAGWVLAVVAIGALARSRHPRPAAATLELRPEPPAVVNLLTNRGTVNAAAAVATLLDLAARHIIELYQPDADERGTVLRVRVSRPDGLRPYENRVFDRVRRQAGRGWLPLADLARSTADDPLQWSRRFAEEVEADARSRGLVRGSAFGLSIAMLFVAVLLSCVVGGLIGAAIGYPDSPDDAGGGSAALATMFAVWCGLPMAFIVLTVAVMPRHALTRRGRAAARHWLGVARWLRAHDRFADLPAAAITTWDRYLSYGAALETTPYAAETIDLRVGHRGRVWVDRGGVTRPIRVRYPRPSSPLSPRPAVRAAVWVGLAVAAAVGLAYGVGVTVDWPRIGPLVALGGLLVVVTARSAVRAVLDAARPVEATGVLASLTVAARHPSELDEVADLPAHPFAPTWFLRRIAATSRANSPRHYAVLDDGTSEPLVAWNSPGRTRSRCGSVT